MTRQSSKYRCIECYRRLSGTEIACNHCGVQVNLKLSSELARYLSQKKSLNLERKRKRGSSGMRRHKQSILVVAGVVIVAAALFYLIT